MVIISSVLEKDDRYSTNLSRKERMCRIEKKKRMQALRDKCL